MIYEKQKNYIIVKAYTFLDKFINELNYNSIIFPKLLYLDGDKDLYKNEFAYCSDLSNLEKNKPHLRGAMLPKILILCNTENKKKHLLLPNLVVFV